jgi:UDP-N-acetylglucosamine 2-epimerase
MVDIYYPNLPRPQFLGLLKNCHRFVTNSSCAIYEAPHFLKPEQIVQIGNRNLNRPRGPFEPGASDRIVAILKDYLT